MFAIIQQISKVAPRKFTANSKKLPANFRRATVAAFASEATLLAEQLQLFYKKPLTKNKQGFRLQSGKIERHLLPCHSATLHQEDQGR